MRKNPRCTTWMPAMLLVFGSLSGMTMSTQAENMIPAVMPDGAEAQEIRPEALLQESPLILLSEKVLHLSVEGGKNSHETALTIGSIGNGANLLASAAGEPLTGKLQDWVAVESHLLDDSRGGFDTSLRLTLSFGIERAVYLNGALVTTTSFNLPAMNGIGTGDAGAVSMAGSSGLPISSVAILQNGAGNSFTAGLSNLPQAATIIQNTLNNQSILSHTTINASANSLELLRANTFQGLLKDGIGQSVVPH